MTARVSADLRLRPRLYRGTEIALGPGKAELIRAIQTTGSIRRAATQLEMSYARAWLLVQTMNNCFTTPLILTRRGGNLHGAATLSATGARVLRLYDEIQTAGARAAAPYARALERHLKP